MKPLTKKPKLRGFITVYIFQDFEITQHERFQGSEKILKHRVNYGVAQKFVLNVLTKILV